MVSELWLGSLLKECIGSSPVQLERYCLADTELL